MAILAKHTQYNRTGFGAGKDTSGTLLVTTGRKQRMLLANDECVQQHPDTIPGILPIDAGSTTEVVGRELLAVIQYTVYYTGIPHSIQYQRYTSTRIYL